LTGTAEGLNPENRRLFVIDASKGLRATTHKTSGKRGEAQRCKQHKQSNAAGHYLDAEVSLS